MSNEYSANIALASTKKTDYELVCELLSERSPKELQEELYNQVQFGSEDDSSTWAVM